jgi:hydrogenase expression/formation protein HypC
MRNYLRNDKSYGGELMCLAVPAKVIELKENRGIVDLAGVRREADFSLLPEVKVGDWVIIHAGFAIEKYSEEEAQETLRLISEMLDASGE